MVKRRNKYNAVRTEYNGIEYDSALEASRAMQLDGLLRATDPDIEDWARQVDTPLGDNDIVRLDFVVLEIGGDVHAEEVKGGPTPKSGERWMRWRATGTGRRYGRLVKLWKQYGEYPLCVLFPIGRATGLKQQWHRQWVEGGRQ